MDERSALSATLALYLPQRHPSMEGTNGLELPSRHNDSSTTTNNNNNSAVVPNSPANTSLSMPSSILKKVSTPTTRQPKVDFYDQHESGGLLRYRQQESTSRIPSETNDVTGSFKNRTGKKVSILTEDLIPSPV
ncbi:hypothetical protein, conserved [Angomonas deanei]|uniref:Uncharacterized protein n=1 Tax=Angomonas deanei TaxID=59799 RepID=A0A7G2C3B6_9TRYP|nr:hypothetical protein, conserved [Angomonas deanei]